MKNIKKSIFLSMIIAVSISGMEDLSPAKQILSTILSVDKYQKEQQRAMEEHQQNQQIEIENHRLNQQIAKDHLKMAHDNHRVQQQVERDNHQVYQWEAKFHQRVATDNHAACRLSVIDNQLREGEKQRRERERQDAASSVTFHKSQIKIAKAQAALKKIEVESQAEIEQIRAKNAFRQCLVKNRSSSDLGLSGIPKDCEDAAKVFRLLGSGSEVDALIESFKK